MKQKLSLFVKNLFLRLGVYALIRRLKPNRDIAILRYHAVVRPQDNFYTSPPIALPPKAFERQVRYLARRYRVLSLDEAIDIIRSGQTPPPNSIVFTFDDGYRDNLQAAQILHRYGVSGTFYVVTEAIGRESRFWLGEVTYLILKTPKKQLQIRYGEQAYDFALEDTASRWQAIRTLVRLIKSNDRACRDSVMAQLCRQLGEETRLREVEELMLDWSEVMQMRDMGMVIGAHTLSHLNLPNADPADARREISGSKKVLEAKLAQPCRHFSYPNSGPYAYFNERIREYVVAAGFDSACTSNQGFLHPGSDLFAIDRVRTVPELAEVIHGMEWERVFGAA